MTTVVNFKTDPKIKLQAQNIAQTMGLNLSDVINVYLREFVKTKRLYISLDPDESRPSDELLADMKAAKKEYRLGKMRSFASATEAAAYYRKKAL